MTTDEERDHHEQVAQRLEELVEAAKSNGVVNYRRVVDDAMDLSVAAHDRGNQQEWKLFVDVAKAAADRLRSQEDLIIQAYETDFEL